MKVFKKKLTALLGIILLVGSLGVNFFSTTVSATTGLAEYAGRYYAYGSVTTDGGSKIDIAKIASDGSLTEQMVAYCLQYYFGYPKSLGDEARPAIYDKGTLEESDITGLAAKKEKLKTVLYYGYPTDGLHYVEDQVISASRLRAVTQFAIWNVMDGKTAEDFQLSGTELEIFNQLTDGTLKAPAGFEPVLFKNDRNIVGDPGAHENKKYYQHLIGSTKAATTYTAYAQKKWEVAPTSETTVTFKLVNKDGSEIKDYADATKTLTTKAGATESDVVFWDKLPKNTENYTVVEVSKTDGYYQSPVQGAGKKSTPFTITNRSSSVLAIPSIQVNKRWSVTDNSQKEDIYFGIYRVDKNGKEELVTKEMAPYSSGTFTNPVQVTSNSTSASWQKVYLPLLVDTNNQNGDKYNYTVKELRKNDDGSYVEWTKAGFTTSYDYTSTKEGSRTYTVTNTYKAEFSFQFGKVAADNEASQLSGAEMRIVKVDDSTSPAKESTIDSWTSGADLHKVTLKPGKYKLVEDEAPASYTTATAVEFTVSQSGELTFTSGQDQIKTTNGSYNLVNKKEVLAKVTFKKQDSSNQALAGAVLSIANADTKEVVASFKTQATDREITLKPGTYTVSETEAPKGFTTVEPFSFTVDEKGTVTGLKKTKEADTITLTNGTITIVDQKEVTAVSVKMEKIWSTSKGEAKTEDFPEQVTFKLYANGKPATDLTGKDVSTVTLTKASADASANTATVSNLPAVDAKGAKIVYTIEEVPVAGYTEVGRAEDKTSATASTWDAADNSYTLFIQNKENGIEKKDVVFSKTNIAGEEISGAQIEIQQNGQKVVGWTSEAGKSHTVQLATGEYVFHEVAAPNGYKVVTDITFTVDKDGNVEVVKDTETANKSTAKGNKLTVVDEIITHSVEISKQNIAGENLANAKVTVTDKSGNVVTDVNGTKVQQFVTTKDNLKLQLPAGEYTFVEDAAPAGYDVVSTFKFTVDTNGKVTTTSTDAKTNGSVLTVVDQATKVVPKEFKVAISKVGLGGVELAGADVTVTKDGQEVDRWTSTTTSHELTLTEGTYVFHEISAPNGYKVVTDITFTVDKDGNVAVTKDTTTGTKTVVAGNKLVITDETITHSVEISKQNIAGENLANAKVTVTDKSGNVVTDVNGTKVQQFVTTKDNLKLQLPAGEYTFVEDAAPAGYDVVSTFKFTVDTNGKVTTTSTDAKTNGSVLTVVDQATKYPVEISKQNIAGENLANAKVTVTDKSGNVVTDVNGTKVEQFVTTKDNLKLQLPAGEYTFVEDAAPAGYDVVSTFKFTVDTNGKVTTTSTDAKTNGSVLTVVDQATKVVPKEFKVAISKVGLGGVELAGADVTVTKDGQEVDRWTSTTTSHELTLTEGTYVFHEISAPNGYKVVTDITFTVDKDGNVAVTKDTTTGTKTVVAGNKLVITDETTAHDVLFSKTDLGGSEIAGAQIEIRDTANNLVTSWTSEAGVTKQVSLNEGTYTFNEVVAPDGFVKVTAITFTVSADGQVYVVHSDQNKVTSSRNHLTVIDDAVAKPIETPKGSLTVQKVDATSNAVLQGAVFSVVGNITETTSTVDSSKVDAALAAKQEEIAQLQAKLAELEETAKATDAADAAAVEANRLAIENAQKALDTANNSYSALLIEKANLKPTVTSKTVTKDFGTVTTDANGVASLTELPDGEYTITETQAPAGYDLDSTPHVVTIKDGQASVASNTLVVTNSKTVTPTPQFDITIRKVDLGGSELAGAQIQVKQGDAVISEWTSTGQAQVVSLKPGTYTFHEVAAPNGYKVVTDITFSVDETGQVAILSARADEAKVVDNALVVTDHKVQQQKDEPKPTPTPKPKDETPKDSSSTPEPTSNAGSKRVLPATNSTDSKGAVVAGLALLLASLGLAFVGKKKKA